VSSLHSEARILAQTVLRKRPAGF